MSLNHDEIEIDMDNPEFPDDKKYKNVSSNVKSNNLTIPDDYVAFKDFKRKSVLSRNITVKTEIFEHQLFDKKKVKKWAQFISRSSINHDTNNIIIILEFDEDNVEFFNEVVESCILSINDLTQILKAAHEYFNEYTVSRVIQNKIDKYISKTGNYTKVWRELTESEDYCGLRFKHRKLPYFTIQSDWAKANIDAIDKKASESDYPPGMFGGNTTNKSDDFALDINIAETTHNLDAWRIMPRDKYPNIERLTERIVIFYQLGLERQSLRLLLKLLQSPKHCHIVKEPAIWEIYKPLMKQNPDLNKIIRYAVYYSMYILRHEETIMKGFVLPGYRIMFSLEQAHGIPGFQKSHIEQTPYIQQLPMTTRIPYCMPFYLKGKREICSKKEFQRRFEIFTGGAFTGIDLKALGFAVTGSCLVPCVHKNPLEDNYPHDLKWNRERASKITKYPNLVSGLESKSDLAFANYITACYPGYDNLTDADYVEQVLTIKPDDIDPNRLKYEEEDVNDEIVKEIKPEENKSPKKKIVVKRSRKSGKRRLAVRRNPAVPSDSDLSESSESESEESEPEEKDKVIVSKKITPDDYKHKKELIDKLKASGKFKPNRPGKNVAYNQLADIDISNTSLTFAKFKENVYKLYEQIKKNCEHRGPVYIRAKLTIASTKFVIYGPGLVRPMDIFRISYSPAKMVKNFHLQCVKMYYNNDITMFRECITSLLTGVNDYYKWFTCNKIPIDVILKYAMRGITTILNDVERDASSNYIDSDNRWGPILKRLRINPVNMYCVVGPEHSFFRLTSNDSGIHKSLRTFDLPKKGFTSSKVIEYPNNITKFGDLTNRTLCEVNPPNVSLMESALDHIIPDDNVLEDLDDVE